MTQEPANVGATGVYRWAKDMERTFDTRVVQGMVADAQQMGWSERIVDWDADQTRTICHRVVAYLKTLRSTPVSSIIWPTRFGLRWTSRNSRNPQRWA